MAVQRSGNVINVDVASVPVRGATTAVMLSGRGRVSRSDSSILELWPEGFPTPAAPTITRDRGSTGLDTDPNAVNIITIPAATLTLFQTIDDIIWAQVRDRQQAVGEDPDPWWEIGTQRGAYRLYGPSYGPARIPGLTFAGFQHFSYRFRFRFMGWTNWSPTTISNRWH